MNSDIICKYYNNRVFVPEKACKNYNNRYGILNGSIGPTCSSCGYCAGKTIDMMHLLRQMTKNTIVWDIDGVIRDLRPAVKLTRKKDETKDHEWCDKDAFLKTLHDNPRLLSAAPTYDYINVIYKYRIPMTLFTRQDMKLFKYTDIFLEEVLDKKNLIYDVYYFLEDGIDKTDYIGENAILVEDSPFLKNYDNVWLIDKPYNQDVDISENRRIKTVEQLDKLVKEKMEETHG